MPFVVSAYVGGVRFHGIFGSSRIIEGLDSSQFALEMALIEVVSPILSAVGRSLAYTFGTLSWLWSLPL